MHKKKILSSHAAKEKLTILPDRGVFSSDGVDGNDSSFSTVLTFVGEKVEEAEAVWLASACVVTSVIFDKLHDVFEEMGVGERIVVLNSVSSFFVGLQTLSSF